MANNTIEKPGRKSMAAPEDKQAASSKVASALTPPLGSLPVAFKWPVRCTSFCPCRRATAKVNTTRRVMLTGGRSRRLSHGSGRYCAAAAAGLPTPDDDHWRRPRATPYSRRQAGRIITSRGGPYLLPDEPDGWLDFYEHAKFSAGVVPVARFVQTYALARLPPSCSP